MPPTGEEPNVTDAAPPFDPDYDLIADMERGRRPERARNDAEGQGDG